MKNKTNLPLWQSIPAWFAVVALFVLASGCSAPKPPLSFDNTDACKHAKQMLIAANEECKESCSSIFARISGNAQNQVIVAAHAVKAACADAEDGKNETWVCAEGHSCR